MKILSLTCPFCSAGLKADSGSKFADCPYCGQRFMIYDEDAEKKAHKIRKTDELLFDDAVTYLQRGNAYELESVFEKLKKDSPSNPDGWFFEGCYYILTFVEEEDDDWDTPEGFDDDSEFSDMIKNVRSCWMRAFKYVKDEDLVEEYFRYIGYSLGHLSRLFLFDENENQVLNLLDDIHKTVPNLITVSECYHIAFLGLIDIFKTMNDIDRRSDLYELLFYNTIAYDANITSVVKKFDELNSMMNNVGLGTGFSVHIAALNRAFQEAQSRLSSSDINRIAASWTEDLIDSKLSKYWDALMDAEEPSGIKSFFKKKGPDYDSLARDYVNALIRGPSGS